MDSRAHRRQGLPQVRCSYLPVSISPSGLDRTTCQSNVHLHSVRARVDNSKPDIRHENPHVGTCSMKPLLCAISRGETILGSTDINIFTSRFSDHYQFTKPNDRRALDLMNAAAVEVMKELPDLCIAYGVSDEFRYVHPFLPSNVLPSTNQGKEISIDRMSSFVFHPSCQLFERRSA